jgi:hypothetical protein
MQPTCSKGLSCAPIVSCVPNAKQFPPGNPFSPPVPPSTLSVTLTPVMGGDWGAAALFSYSSDNGSGTFTSPVTVHPFTELTYTTTIPDGTYFYGGIDATGISASFAQLLTFGAGSSTTFSGDMQYNDFWFADGLVAPVPLFGLANTLFPGQDCIPPAGPQSITSNLTGSSANGSPFLSAFRPLGGAIASYVCLSPLIFTTVLKF